MTAALRMRAPGLRWRRRKEGPVPTWHARSEAVELGFSPSRVELPHLAADPARLRAKCKLLNATQEMWLLECEHRTSYDFDGTVGSLLRIYRLHPESPYSRLRASSLKMFNSSLQRLTIFIGERLIDDVNGIDIAIWSREWSKQGRHLAAAGGMRTVLLSALRFGVALRLDGCAELTGVIRSARGLFPSRSPRTAFVTAKQVEALCQAAHRNGRPSRALAYSFMFEAVLRLGDVVGIWWPPNLGRRSDIEHPASGHFWFGLRWEEIDNDLVLRRCPSKTERSRGHTVVYPLRAAPMVLDELRHVPLRQRSGPLIVNEATGLPYQDHTFNRGYHIDRQVAGIDRSVWARDLRASGITEARQAGAAIEDAAKVAGHAKPTITTEVYDRAAIEAAERFAAKRLEARKTALIIT